jgi:hypothetical protein
MPKVHWTDVALPGKKSTAFYLVKSFTNKDKYRICEDEWLYNNLALYCPMGCHNPLVMLVLYHALALVVVMKKKNGKDEYGEMSRVRLLWAAFVVLPLVPDRTGAVAQ